MNPYDSQWCQKVLSELTSMPISNPFRSPVNPAEVPSYREKIQNPMDLSTMKKKLQHHQYNTVEEFISDIKLICENSRIFNGAETIYGLLANDIERIADKMYKEKPVSALDEWLTGLQKIQDEIDSLIKNPPEEIKSQTAQALVPAV